MRWRFLILGWMLALSAWGQDVYEFTNILKITKSGLMDKSLVCVAMPVPVSNEYQTITDAKPNVGRVCKANNTGMMTYVKVEDLRAEVSYVAVRCNYQSHPVVINFNDTTTKNFIPGTDVRKYLGNEGEYVNLRNKWVRQTGDSLWALSNDSVLRYARLCYDYIGQNFRYIKGPFRTLKQVLKEGGGECGDLSTIFVNLMRYKGIPARHNLGMWLDCEPNGLFHVWPDFYMPEYGWVPVDPTNKVKNWNDDVFGRYNGGLVIMTQGMSTFSDDRFHFYDEPLQGARWRWWYWGGNGEFEFESQSMFRKVDESEVEAAQ